MHPVIGGSRLAKLGAALVLAGVVVSLQAGLVVLDTFGPGDSYDTDPSHVRHLTSAVSPYSYQGVALSFTPTVSGTLEKLTLATGFYSGVDEMVVWVRTDTSLWGGNPPLEIFSAQASAGLQTATSVTQPLLEAGSIYWIIAMPIGSSSDLGWYANDRGFVGSVGSASVLGVSFSTGTLPAVRVEVGAVPEPQTGATLAALGVLGYALWRRVRPMVG